MDLKFATGESDTGVIISWNTEGRKSVDENAYNIVVLPNPDYDGIAAVDFFGPQSYHEDDYSLFYNNIKENVEKRIAAYMADTAAVQ